MFRPIFKIGPTVVEYPPVTFKLEHSRVPQVKSVKTFILFCLRAIAELVAEISVLTFFVVPLCKNNKLPPAVISPNVDNLFIDNIDDESIVVPPVELIVLPLIVMLLPAIMVDCFPLKVVSIPEIFVEILVVPYTKFGAVMVVPVLPVILPQLIVPVVILLYEFKLVPVEEIVLFEILIFVPAINVDCLPFNDDKIELILLPTFITPLSSSIVNIFDRTSPFIAGDIVVFVEKGAT